jgi:hypothetical protein
MRRSLWEKPMPGRNLTRAAFVASLLPAVLGGCTGAQYKNASHPGYGDAEYKNDLAQCRKENSKIVMSSGYDDKSSVEVDEGKAQSCMNGRGWQAVSR